MFLSICIPSYNRFDRLKKTVDSLMKASSQDFEVVISDNCSAEDIRTYISTPDPRVRIIKRETSIPGPTNGMYAIDSGLGEYVMTLLDKDFIDGDFLDFFIEGLKKLEGITCGYCELNCQMDDWRFHTSNKVKRNIFRCNHPSGMFFRRDCILHVSENMGFYDEESEFYSNSFLADLVYAKCLVLGKQAVYEGKLVFTETFEEASAIKSHTYSAQKGNLFFLPQNRINQFWIFVDYTETLGLSRRVYKRIIYKLISKTVSDVSSTYRNIMRNESICYHYNIETGVITIKDEITQILGFAKNVDEKRECLLISKHELRVMLGISMVKTVIWDIFRL